MSYHVLAGMVLTRLKPGLPTRDVYVTRVLKLVSMRLFC